MAWYPFLSDVVVMEIYCWCLHGGCSIY